MKILSLFDGISCARVALDRAGIPVEAYYASEIDKYAMQISAKNWPDIVHLGSVTEVHSHGDGVCIHGHEVIVQSGEIDLLIGGSPCQDLSIAKKERKGLDGARSGLFWEYVRILNEVKPRYFVLENVASMPKEAKALISETLGVQPIMIDAALVSAQRRKRLFWVGKRIGDKYEQVVILLPEDRGIFLKDILQPESEVDEKYYIKDATLQTILEKMRQGKPLAQAFRIHQTDGKGVTLSAMGGGSGAKTGLYFVPDEKGNVVMIVPEATKAGYAIAQDGDAVDLSFPTSKTRRGRVGDKAKNLMTSSTICVYVRGRVRKLTPIECERLQSVPDRYTEGQSDAQRYKACGNAFNAEVVAHILRSAHD